MANEKELKQAQTVFDTMCEMLDDDGWKYEKDPADLSVSCTAQGEDLPIDVNFKIIPELQLVTLVSQMPFKVPENRRTELAVAISRANYGMVDGNFDFDLKNGVILFRLTSSFMGSLLSKELLSYMLYVSCGTVDKYNDKFFILCKNSMTVGEVVDFIE